MKAHFFSALLFCIVLVSCQSSLPSGVYLQNLNTVAKPLYNGKNQSAIQLSGGYSKLGIHSMDLEDVDNPRSSDDYYFESEINSGFLEVVYGYSHEHFSYALGTMGVCGQYKGISNSPFTTQGNRSFVTYGLGAKANASYDINHNKVSIRLVQLQVGVSQDFGDYSEMRGTYKNVEGQQLKFDVVHPENALVWNGSISTIVNFKIANSFRARIGGAVGYVHVDGVKRDNVVHQVDFGAGYKAIDFFGSVTTSFFSEAGIADILKFGVGYHFPLKS